MGLIYSPSGLSTPTKSLKDRGVFCWKQAVVDINTGILALFAIVLLAYITQTMAGFGSLILAVTLGSNFYPIEFLLPVLVPLNVLVNGYIVTRHRRLIHKQVLFKKIFPLMLVGLFLGILLFNLVQGQILKKVFGIFVVAMSAIQLLALRKTTLTPPVLSPAKSRVFILFGGVIHGLYASGGPLVVYVASRLNLDKSVFRSTLSALWLILNCVLMISYAVTGRLSFGTFAFTGALTPLIIIGIFIGERLHTIINQKQFKIFIFMLLLIAGFSIVLR